MRFFLLWLLFLTPLAAHPHVSLGYTAIVIVKEKHIQEIKLTMRFDPLFSSFELRRIEGDKSGNPLAEDLKKESVFYMDHLKTSQYFTSAKLKDVKIGFGEAKDISLILDKEHLLLSFTLPLRAALKIDNEDFSLDLFDPAFYFALQPDEGEFLKVEGEGCRSNYKPPVKLDTKPLTKLNESFFDQLTAGFAKDYAGAMVISCR